MADITLTFTSQLPADIHVGDIAWYLDISESKEVKMGPISSINQLEIVISAAAGVDPPTTADFVFYTKNPIGYLGQLKGYYAEAQFINNSTEYAELFAVGSEVFESSK